MEAVAYADPQAFYNFKERGHLGGVHGREWMWASPEKGLVPMYPQATVDTLLAQLEAAEADYSELRLTRLRDEQLLAAWRSRAEAAEAECAAWRALVVPRLGVYKGDYVVQIDAGKNGLFTERYSDDADLPRAISAVQDRALAARTKEKTK